MVEGTGRIGLCQGKYIVIQDVIGFFQSSFLSAVAGMKGNADDGAAGKAIIVAQEEQDLLDWGKPLRGDFSNQDMNEIIKYNRAEIVVLARMMAAFKKAINELGLYPTKWHGPGVLAEEKLQRMGIIPKKEKGEAKKAFAARLEAWMAAGGDEVVRLKVASTSKTEAWKRGAASVEDVETAQQKLEAALQEIGEGPRRQEGEINHGHYPELSAGKASTAQDWAHHAFSGGRIELIRPGVHCDPENPIYQWDVTSAYPWIIFNLPSMRHEPKEDFEKRLEEREAGGEGKDPNQNANSLWKSSRLLLRP